MCRLIIINTIEARNRTYSLFRMIVNKYFTLSILVIIFGLIPNALADELVSVVLLFRGGERTIISSYPNDPYKNISYWPEGFGQLILKGKKGQFMLGQFYKRYYIDFTSSVYKKSDILAYASDADRAQMSAALYLSGFDILDEKDQWVPGSFWEPIPVHSTPVEEDPVLAQGASCPRRDKLIEDQKESDFYRNVNKENKELFEFLSDKTGWEIDDIEYIEKLFSIMNTYSGSYENYIPGWYKSLNHTHMRYLAGLSMARKTSTSELKRLVAGPLLEFLFNYWDQIISNNAPKFLILSAHGHTVAAFLDAMGHFKLHPPDFSVTVMIEMYKRDDGTFYVTMTYKNYDFPGLDPFHLSGCHMNCDYKIYKKILSHISINNDDWKKECSNTTVA